MRRFLGGNSNTLKRRKSDATPVKFAPDFFYSWRDVDVEHCTDEELLYCVAQVLRQCKSDTLDDKSVVKFWEVRAELERREGIHIA